MVLLRPVSMALLMALVIAPAPVVRVASGQSEASGPGREQPGRVGLDQLLKLPDTLDFDYERRGGRTRVEWRALFDETQQSVDLAKQGLAEAQDRLAAVAGRSDNWNMAPPGMPIEMADDNPDTRALREEVRRWRAEIERAEARQREVVIEASLAGVPEDWRGARTEAGSEDGSVTRGPSAP